MGGLPNRQGGPGLLGSLRTIKSEHWGLGRGEGGEREGVDIIWRKEREGKKGRGGNGNPNFQEWSARGTQRANKGPGVKKSWNSLRDCWRKKMLEKGGVRIEKEEGRGLTGETLTQARQGLRTWLPFCATAPVISGAEKALGLTSGGNKKTNIKQKIRM